MEQQIGSRSRFLEQYAGRLEAWGKELAGTSGPVVAIARKGPRLLELLAREGLAPPDLIRRVVTERAIPFLGTNLKSVVVTDDSVAHGSTFGRVVDHVRLLVPDRRESAVIGLPFAVGPRVPDIYRSIIHNSHVPLTDGEETAFVNAEIAAFRLLGKPYDLEHPLLTLHLDGCGDVDDLHLWLEDVAHRLDGSLIEHTMDVPRGTTLVRLTSWTIITPAFTDPSCEFAKIRIYTNPDRTELVFAMMRSLTLTPESAHVIGGALPASLHRAWEKTVRASEPAREHLPPFLIEYSLAVWANFLAEVTLLPVIREALLAAPIAPVLKIEAPQLFDVQLLVGSAAAEATATIRAYLDDGTPVSAPLSSPIRVDTLPQERIPETLAKAYEEGVVARATSAATVVDVVSAIFQSQHAHIELASRTPTANPTRLEFGITLQSIAATIRRFLPSFQMLDVHRALDALIDAGAIVPRYVNFGAAESPVWVRAFRVGEATVEYRAHVVSLLFRTLAKEVGTETLPATLLEKYAVLVLSVASDNRDLFPLRILSLQKRFHLYGARVALPASENEEFLFDWAVNNKLLARGTRRQPTRHDGHAESPSSQYTLDRQTLTLFPERECPWDAEVRDAFEDIASIVRVLHEKEGLRDKALVLLTTLASPRELHRALEAELRLWLYDPRASVYQALRALSTIAEKSADGAIPQPMLRDANETLSATANFTAQVKVKKDLYANRNKMLTMIDDAVTAKGDRAISRAWTNLHKTLSARGTSELGQSGLTEITSALRICYQTNILLRDLLTMAGWQDPRAKTVESSVASLRSLLLSAEVDPVTKLLFVPPQGESITSKLDRAMAAKPTSFAATFAALRPCLHDIAEQCEIVLSNFGTAEQWVIPQVLEPPLFIMMWDVRGSTEQASRTDLERLIKVANERIAKVMQGSVLDFDPYSTDDGNGLICFHFEQVVGVFTILNETFANHSFRAGVEVNLQGRLNYYPAALTNRLGEESYGGRAYEYAARVTTFFKEIANKPERWLGSRPPDEPPGAYLVVGEFARRFAEHALSQPWPPTNAAIVTLDGRYVPRISGAFPMELTLLLPVDAPSPSFES